VCVTCQLLALVIEKSMVKNLLFLNIQKIEISAKNLWQNYTRRFIIITTPSFQWNNLVNVWFIYRYTKISRPEKEMMLNGEVLSE